MEDFFEEEKKEAGSNPFDMGHYLFRLSKNYGWILLCMALALFGANLYIRTEVPKYEVSGYILIGGGNLEGGTNSILANAGMISTDNSSINNEIFILKSHLLIGQVVDSLQLYQRFSKKGTFKDVPIQQETLPVVVKIKRKFPERQGNPYQVLFKSNSFVFKNSQKEYQGKYGQLFILDQDSIRIYKKPGQVISKQKYNFEVDGRLSTTKRYISRLNVLPAKNAGAGLLQVSVTDELPLRATRFISVLIQKYNESSLNFKKQAIRSAIAFLGKRLITVGEELNEQENEVRDFKISNKLYDVSTAAQDILTDLKTLDVQNTENVYQEQLLDLVANTIKNYNGKEELIATAAGLQDPVLNVQIGTYNAAVMEKQAVLSTGTEFDPRLHAVNDRLSNLRQNILKNIVNIRSQFKMAGSHYSEQENRLSGKFETLPAKEQEFISLNRRLNIKQSLYLFLLQKREETEIQLISSDEVKSRVVDEILNGGIVSPIQRNVYAIAGLAGLLAPCLVLLAIVFFNRKIESRKEIEKRSKIPILGELSLSPSASPIVITAMKRSAIAEQIRAIRTNLSFIGGDSPKQVLLITSFVSGEGKSFVSLNLANSLAISNKKVAILELDLRKPKLSKSLGIKNKKGITNYLIDDTMLPEEIIQQLADYPNLHILNSGPIPPNPGELIINPRMTILLNYLRANFDYIILDSPPVGLVADALNLAKLADISIFIIRHNYSDKSALDFSNELYTNNKLPHLSLVINGIQISKGYGSGGNYGYGYGYYEEDI